MKTASIFATLLLALSFSSCGDILFSGEMPASGKSLQAIPEDCQGTFESVEEGGAGSEEFFTLTADRLILDESEPLILNKHFTLRTDGNWHYANFKEENGFYYVMPFRPKGPGMLEYGMFVVEDEEAEKQLGAITSYSDREEDFLSAYEVRVSDKQFEELMRSPLLELALARKK